MTDTPDEPLAQTPLDELNSLLRDERRRWLGRFVGLGLVALIALGFALRSNQIADKAQTAAGQAQAAADKAQDAIDLVLAQRVESRLNTCTEARVFGLAHNGLVQYFAALADEDTPPGLIEDFLAKNIVPVRECTPEAIEDFYEGKASVKAGATSEPVPFEDGGG